jgi:predicted nucleic acid-binding protein
MQVLVDTCIWSLALRRKSRNLNDGELALQDELRELIDEGRAQLIGPVRQEILSGIRDDAQFERVREYLRAFTDEPLTSLDYELAAGLCNQCRTAGLAGSAIDLLLCALATGRKWPIFTTDGDFKRYGRVFPIGLHAPRR